jgi:hypothetical protein
LSDRSYRKFEDLNYSPVAVILIKAVYKVETPIHVSCIPCDNQSVAAAEYKTDTRGNGKLLLHNISMNNLGQEAAMSQI